MENASRQPSRIGTRFNIVSVLRRQIVLLIFLALFASRSAPAAVVALTDGKGNAAITVQPKGTFQVVLSVAEANDMAGFQVLLGVQGPVSLVGMPAVGTWFAEGHEYDTYGNETTPFIALLSDRSAISGTGELAVFAFSADSDGVATVSVSEDALILAGRSGVASEWESAGAFTVTIGDGKSTTIGQTGQELSSSQQSGSGGGMLLTVDCCASTPPYPCTDFMKNDVIRTTDSRIINILDLTNLRNALGEQLDDEELREGHFPTRDGAASDLDNDGKVNILDSIICRSHLNEQCGTILPGIEITEITLQVRDDNNNPVGDPQAITPSSAQLWNTEYWELDHSFYLDANLKLEIRTTFNMGAISNDMEVRWVQLVDDGNGNPVRPTTGRPSCEIENITGTGPEQITHHVGSNTCTFLQVIDGGDVTPGSLATLTMETFICTGDENTLSEMTAGPTICVHQRPHLIAASVNSSAQSFAENDTILLTFDQPTNQYAITNSNIGDVLLLSNGHTWGSIQEEATLWVTDRELLITFGEGERTIALGDLIMIPESTIKDDAGTQDAVGMPTAVSVQPILIAAAASTGLGFVENDTVVLTFDRSTNKYEISTSNIGQILLLSNGSTWGAVNTSWSSDRQLVITFDVGQHTVAVGDTIRIAQNTIKDASGTYAAVGLPTPISLQPHLVSAVAQINEACLGFQEGDTLTLTFDVYTNVNSLFGYYIEDYLILPNGHTWGNVGRSWEEPDNVLLIKFGEGSHTVAVGDWINIAPGTIKDGDEEQYDAIGSPPRIAVQPRIVAVEAVPAAGPYYGIQEGDLVRIWFNVKTNGFTIPLAAAEIDEVLQLSDGVNTHSWGTIGYATWQNSHLDIILAAGTATVDIGDTITIHENTIRDATGLVDALPVSDPPITITGTFGSAPHLVQAYATESGGHAPGIDTGSVSDQVILVFDAPTNGYAFNGDLDTALPLSSNSWGSSSTAVWTSVSWPNDCLIITPAPTSTVRPFGYAGANCDSIVSITSGYIQDPNLLTGAEAQDVPITGDFGPAPQILMVVAGGNQVIIQFNNATNGSDSGLTTLNIDTVLALSKDETSHSWGAVDALVWSQTKWSNDTLKVALSTEGSGRTIEIGDYITIESGTITYPGTTYTTYYAQGSPPGITGYFGDAPRLVSAVADQNGCGKTGIQYGDTLTLSFDRETNQFAITSANIDSVLCVIDRSWERVLSAVWAWDGPYYVCTITFDSVEEYSEGIVALVKDDATVELADGIWPAWAADGYLVIDGEQYEVLSRTDDDTIELEAPWAGDDMEYQPYSIERRRLDYDPPGDTDSEPHEGDWIYLFSGEITGGDSNSPAWGDPVKITGSFGEAPSLQTVTANANGSTLGGGQQNDQIVLTFSDPIDTSLEINSTNVDEVLPVTRSGETVTWGALASAVWNDSTTLTITLGTGEHGIDVGDLVSVAAGHLKDEDGLDDVVGSVIVAGSFGTIPVVASAVAIDTSSEGYGINEGDIVIITFNQGTNGAEINASNIDEVLQLDDGYWGALAANGCTWSTNVYENDTLIVWLGPGSHDVAASNGITINSGSTAVIKDPLESYPAEGYVLINGSFGEAPALLSAIAYPRGNTTASGIQDDDALVLQFDQSMHPFSGNLATALSAIDDQQQQHDWGGFTFAWSTTQFTNDTLTITFDGTGSPTIAVGDSITIAAGTLQDDTEIADATSEVKISGTFGGAPNLISALAVPSGDTFSGIQDGDQVVLTFDSSCYEYEFSFDEQYENYIGKVLVLSEHTWGQPTLAAWSTKTYTYDTLTVTLASAGGSTIAVDDWITIASGTIHALNEQLDATGSQCIDGSFGLPTKVLSAVAVASGSTAPGIQQGDSIVVRFDRSTNGAEIDFSNMNDILCIDDKEWPEELNAVWIETEEPNDTLTITFSADVQGRTIEVGDGFSIGQDTIENPTNINTDDAENRDCVPITGSFGGSPRLLTAEAVAVDPARGIQDGDQIILTFDAPTNRPTISWQNINGILQLVKPHSWGIIAPQWSSDSFGNDVLTLTFDGTGAPTVEPGDEIVIAPGTITSTDLGAWPATSDISVSGSFGNQPHLLYAILYDALGQGPGIQEGDQAILAFDLPTNGYPIDDQNISSVLVLNQNSWGTIASAQWNDSKDMLTITFGAGSHSVACGNSITIANDTIKSADGAFAAIGSPPTIQGSSIFKAPKLVSAVAADTSGLGPGIQQGDTVVLTFDTPTIAFNFDPIWLDSELPIPGKTWGDDASVEWSSSTVLVITFAQSPATVAVGDEFTITGSFIVGAIGYIGAVGSPPAITGSFASDVNPPQLAITEPTAGSPENALTATSIVVAGTVQDAALVGVTVNGIAATIDNGVFQATVPLLYDDENVLTARAYDTSGNESTATVSVWRDTAPPIIVSYDFADEIIRAGRVDIAISFYDGVSGVDNSSDIDVSLVLAEGTALVFEGELEGDKFAGHTTVPVTACIGFGKLLVEHLKDKVGNEAVLLEETDVPIKRTRVQVPSRPFPPEPDKLASPKPPDVGSEEFNTYVSPFLMGGPKEPDEEVLWRYEECGWQKATSSCDGTTYSISVSLPSPVSEHQKRDLQAADRKIRIEMKTKKGTLETKVVKVEIDWQFAPSPWMIAAGEKLLITVPKPPAYDHKTELRVPTGSDWWPNENGSWPKEGADPIKYDCNKVYEFPEGPDQVWTTYDWVNTQPPTRTQKTSGVVHAARVDFSIVRAVHAEDAEHEPVGDGAKLKQVKVNKIDKLVWRTGRDANWLYVEPVCSSWLKGLRINGNYGPFPVWVKPSVITVTASYKGMYVNSDGYVITDGIVITVQRSNRGQYATLGTFSMDAGEYGSVTGVTLELRAGHYDIGAVDNVTGKPLGEKTYPIPPGEYYGKVDPKFKNRDGNWAIRVLDVPNFTGIAFHTGNYLWEIQGCILVGSDAWQNGVVRRKISETKWQYYVKAGMIEDTANHAVGTTDYLKTGSREKRDKMKDLYDEVEKRENKTPTIFVRVKE